MFLFRKNGIDKIPLSQKVWNAASFLNLPLFKVSKNGQENQIRRDAMPRVFSPAGFPFNQKNHSSDRKCTLKLLVYFFLFAHFLVRVCGFIWNGHGDPVYGYQ